MAVFYDLTTRCPPKSSYTTPLDSSHRAGSCTIGPADLTGLDG